MIGRWLKRKPTRAEQKAMRRTAFEQGGRVPWTDGYADYRHEFVQRVLADEALLATFRHGNALPPQYGVRLDERVVEYPWLFARLSDRPAQTLDAGSTLNYLFLLNHPRVRQRNLLIYTLALEVLHPCPQVSYLFGDLRDTVLRDAVFDEIVCISTLDHIGLDNTKLFTGDERFREQSPRDYRIALRELHRLLKPGGLLWVTVPYGRPLVLSWQQVFDADGLADLVSAFPGELRERAFYRYRPDGWRPATAEECADAEYHDFTSAPPAGDGAAAARAVACLEFRKAP